MIDFHADTAMIIFKRQLSLLSNDRHIDLEKLHQGGYLAQWFAMFVSLNHLDNLTPFEFFTNMYNYFIAEAEKHSDKVTIVSNYDEYKQALTAEKIAAFISAEEGEIIKEGLHMVDKIEDMKVRLITLTWNYQNSLGAPHSMPEIGLTNYGKEVVEYLNQKHILIDVSHLSDAGIDDVLAISKKPIIASHSNARAIYNKSRNLKDSHIKQIASTDGLIGVNYYSGFLSDNKTSHVADILQMTKYLVDIGGENTIGFGSDFDGIDCPLEMKDASAVGLLANALNNEFTAAQVDKLLFKNAERIIRAL